MIRKITGRFYRALVLVMVLSLVLPYVALAATIESDAVLGSSQGAPTEVQIGDNSFQIKVWAHGNVGSQDNGKAEIVTRYTMSADGTIAPSADPGIQTIFFKPGHNYTVTANSNGCPTDQNGMSLKGCEADPFIINAVLTILSGVAVNTSGTLTVDLRQLNGSGVAVANTSEDTSYVKVTKQATTTALSSNKNPSKFNESVTFTATVSPSDATGSVQFFNDTTLLDTASLSGGSASFSTSSLAVGTHSITAKYAGSNAHAESTSTVVSQKVDKAAATITLGNLTGHTYDGSAKAATATTSPAGLSGVSITYKQGDTAVASPTNAGSYDVTATLTNNNYEATPATGTLVIDKATPSINWSNPDNITYGTELGSTQLNASSPVPGSFTYTPAAGTKLNAGSHELQADFTPSNATNYTTASKTVQINVNKAQATISLSNLQHTYDGTAKAATATTNPAGLGGVTISYSQNGQSVAAPTNAGSYDVVASLTNSNYQAQNATGTLVISKAITTLNLSDLSHTYDGSAKEATVTTNPAGLNGVSVTYDGSATAPRNAGSYAVVASLDNNNYKAQNATGTLTIAKAEATITLSDLEHTYNGSAKAATATTTPAGLNVSISYSQNGQNVENPTNAGSYEVVAVISNEANYKGRETGTLVIRKASATVTLSDLNHTYDGEAKAATATTDPAGLTVNLVYTRNGNTVASPTNAGEYSVTGTVNDDNYQGSKTGMLVIEKATATVTLGSLGHTYNGSAKSATATTVPAGLTVDFEYSSGTTKLEGEPVNAGTYSVVATVNDDNYKGSASSDEFKINKAAQTITFAALDNKTYGDAAFKVSATGGDSGQPVTFAASPADVCSVAKDEDGNWMVTIKGAGACTITASQAGNDNYNAAANVARSFSVAKAAATIELSGLSHTYDGLAKAATASASATNPAASNLGDITIVYKQGTTVVTSPTNAGEYSVTATLNNPNYEATPATGTLVIAKANSVVTWANPADITYGTVLGSAQLNATANVGGSFAYTPAAGTKLGAGTHTLRVDFTPADENNYNGASRTVQINVQKAALSVTADSKTKLLGAENPVLTGTLTGVVAGDNITASYSTTATTTSPVGSYPIVPTLNDPDNKLGNYNVTRTNGTLSVIYAWAGFLQPINDTAHQVGTSTSIFKAGSTVPAKFVLKDVHGNVVQAATAPLWITPARGSALTDAVNESLYGETATGGTTYTWTGTHYQYNWGTAKSQGGYYWRIGVKLDDGTTRYVNLGLRS